MNSYLGYHFHGVIYKDNDGLAYSADGYDYNVIPNTLTPIMLFNYHSYDRVNMNYLTFKKPPDLLKVDNAGVVIDCVKVDAINSDDLYKVAAEKFVNFVLIGYDKFLQFPNEYNKIIRRSNVIQSESRINAWRYFQADAYKVITENKGDITNIVGIGLYLLVHCEHSLFLFNRDASLQTNNKDIQLYMPDAFDTQYQEVFTSVKGFGGLQDPKAYSANEFGYIFFDNSNKKLYQFNDKSLDILSDDIQLYLDKEINITNVLLAVDKKNNRLLLTYSTDFGSNTFSYNFITKSWISEHDYTFTNSYNDKTNLFLSNNNNKSKLYKFNNHSRTVGDYNDLSKSSANNHPTYLNLVTNRYNSYFDIVFNIQPELVKTLEYIRYICSDITKYGTNEMYSGDTIQVYTDSCNTDIINISTVKNVFNNYTQPYYNNGVWNFNYFRNKVISNLSDYSSLIYGRYFIFRFIIDNSQNKKIEFSNLEVNTSK